MTRFPFLILGGVLLALLRATPSSAAPPCDEILSFAAGCVPEREVFVAPGGDDLTGDGSRAKPYLTVSKAAQSARAGTAIRLLPGTHRAGQFLEGVSGRAGAPIWVGGEPGQPRPVISGGRQAIHLTRVRYLVVENLEITGATGNGINCDDGAQYANPDATRFVVFRNLLIRDIGTGGNQDSLKLSGLDDYWVIDCEFRGGSGGGSGIDHVGCHRGVIARCRFESMGGNAVQCKGGSEDIEIRWCRFIHAGQRAINIGGSTGFEFFRPPLATSQPNVEARNIRVLANTFEGSDAPVAFVGCVDSVVANNTLINPTRWIVRILQETVSGGSHTFLPCGKSRFINNLVYFRREQLNTFVNVGANTDPDSFTFANNLWYAHDHPAQSSPSLPVAESNGIAGQDPQLADAAAGDFSLRATSPASGRGLTLDGLRADHRQRCYANPPSIGAHEAAPGEP